MLLKRPLKDVGPWRGVFEPSTVTSFTERERVVVKHICLVLHRGQNVTEYLYQNSESPVKGGLLFSAKQERGGEAYGKA